MLVMRTHMGIGKGWGEELFFVGSWTFFDLKIWLVRKILRTCTLITKTYYNYGKGNEMPTKQLWLLDVCCFGERRTERELRGL